MFSLVCVYLVTGEGGPHVTITLDALDLPVQDPTIPVVQTCSLKFPPPGTDIRWSPKHIRLASEWYTSYWNAFLFINMEELYRNLIS